MTKTEANALAVILFPTDPQYGAPKWLQYRFNGDFNVIDRSATRRSLAKYLRENTLKGIAQGALSIGTHLTRGVTGNQHSNV